MGLIVHPFEVASSGTIPAASGYALGRELIHEDYELDRFRCIDIGGTKDWMSQWLPAFINVAGGTSSRRHPVQLPRESGITEIYIPDVRLTWYIGTSGNGNDTNNNYDFKIQNSWDTTLVTKNTFSASENSGTYYQNTLTIGSVLTVNTDHAGISLVHAYATGTPSYCDVSVAFAYRKVLRPA